MRQKSKTKIVILLSLVWILIAMSLSAPHFIPNDPYKTDASCMKVAPCMQFPFGTDNLGRCIFSRVLIGMRISVFSALSLVLITMLFGTIIGIAAGYYGGAIDQIIMRLTDLLLAFPQMILAIAVAGVLGGNMINTMIALGITGWTLYARLARGLVLSLRQEEYVDAARLSGDSTIRMMMIHILPNIFGEIVVNASIQIGVTMLEFAGLSYLGLGVQVPKAEWGSMINEARGYMQLAPWAVLAPGMALFVTTAVFNLLGDAMSEHMGIRSKHNE